MKPPKPKRPPAAHEVALCPSSPGIEARGLWRLPTRNVWRAAWLGSSSSAVTRSSASTTTATMAVVSSALPPGLSCLEASQYCSSSASSSASVLTLRMAASTSAAATRSSCLNVGILCSRWGSAVAMSPVSGAGAPVGSLAAPVQAASALGLVCSPKAPGVATCLSTMRAISSSWRLSKMPSLPRMTMSPRLQLTVLTRAPWITRCVSAAMVFARRMTCTGLLAS
mmetsp:Transcript_118065/g.329096  ORF Transcript_118065/g.329096 Transcript_118065/m.329096 type:complete len:225 (-) Transcript_118065:1104-1778(-)